MPPNQTEQSGAGFEGSARVEMTRAHEELMASFERMRVDIRRAMYMQMGAAAVIAALALVIAKLAS